VEITEPAAGPVLPVHPHTGLTAIGWRRNGAPIWPVRGGSDDGDVAAADQGDGDGTGDGGDQGGDAGADQLGDAGKRALDAMKGKWQTERDGRKAAQARTAELEARVAELEAGANGKADEGKDKAPDLKKVREEAAAAARAETLRERVLDKIETRAAKLFADPEDASALLGRRVDEFIDGGKVDVDAISEALAELLEKKPHLAAAKAPRFEGGADGGARKGSSGPAQLTEQDLKRMSPEAIEKARIEGRLNDLLGVKSQ